jgi:hypothetical protein
VHVLTATDLKAWRAFADTRQPATAEKGSNVGNRHILEGCCYREALCRRAIAAWIYARIDFLRKIADDCIAE